MVRKRNYIGNSSWNVKDPQGVLGNGTWRWAGVRLQKAVCTVASSLDKEASRSIESAYLT